jgi:hypothetical protein
VFRRLSLVSLSNRLGTRYEDRSDKADDEVDDNQDEDYVDDVDLIDRRHDQRSVAE